MALRRPGSPGSVGSTPGSPSSSASSAGGVVLTNLSGSNAGSEWNLAKLARPPGDTPVSYAHSGVLRPVRATESLGHGVEARVYREGTTAFKAFEYRGGTGAPRRDSEFTALQRLDKRAPGLVPKPLSTGVLTMQDRTTRATLAMEHVEGESLPARPSLGTPELTALRPYAARLGAALRDTDTSWDNTPGNVMRTKGGFKFIDVKLNASRLPHPPPHVFAQQTLTLLARNPASVERAMPMTMGSRETPSAVPALPALRPTFPPKKQKAPVSALAPVAEKPRAKLVLPPIGDGRIGR